jgi:hypothetical protein
MRRIYLERDKWFNDEKVAEVWAETLHEEGGNQISNATGSQWDHEELILTSKGAYVIHFWSNWEGRPASYRLIDARTATNWLIRNQHDLSSELAKIAEDMEV